MANANVNSSVAKAVPSSVAPSTKHSVDINKVPQRGALVTPTGERAIPEVPRPEDDPISEVRANPFFGQSSHTGYECESGSSGAPSVPEMNGILFRKGPVDVHYQNEFEGDVNPYKRVNNPATARVVNWIKDYQNHIALTSQEVDPNGFRTEPPQQRTSHMRFTAKGHNPGYDPETSEPHQMPQTPNTYKYNPVVGTQEYGSGHTPYGGGFQVGRVLNSDTYGAGQTAGGIGGNQYTPAAGPPDTTSTAGNDNAGSGMPTWG